MSLIIILAVAAVVLGLSVFALTSTNGKQFVQHNYKSIVALSVLLVPVVAVVSACNSVSAN